MKKQIESGVLLTLLLIGMLIWTFNIQPITAEPSSVENPITLFVIPNEIRVTFKVVGGTPDGWGPKTDFQLGECVYLDLFVEELRGGDFPHIASDIIFVVTNELGDLVWSKSTGPAGLGWSSGDGGAWAQSAHWVQVDSSGSPVPMGTYAAGVRFVEPTYDFPEDFTGVITFTTVNGTSVFVHSNQDLGSASLAVAVGDIDNDGDLDLIFGNGNNTVYRNDGYGTFTSDYVFGISGDHHTKSLRLGDLDGDGDLDLIEGILGANAQVHAPAEIRIYENGGSGDFTYTTQLMQMPPSSYCDNSQFIELADIDNDGDLDIIISLTFSNSLEIFLNNGGAFVRSQTLDSSVPMGCAVGDIDNDGDLDLVVANSEGYPNRVFKNEGSGVFTDTGQRLGEAYTYSVALGDIDNDGDWDLITGNIASQANQNEIYVNNGNGIFTLWQAFGTHRGYPVVLGDIDNDNDMDMITGGYRTIVYLNDGTGHFEESEHSLEVTLSDIVLADIHNDGDLDLITAWHTNKLYINMLYDITPPALSAPTVTVVSPNGGEVWQDMQTITWTATDPQDDPLTYLVYYSPNGGQTWTRLATGLTESSYLWDTTTVVNGINYLIKVEASDGIHIGVDISDSPFEIANELMNTAPTVLVIQPNGGERVRGTFEIQWSANDPNGDTLTFTISYSPNGEDIWTQIASEITETSYVWDTSKVQVGTTYLIKVEASDGRLAAEDSSDAPFTVEREVSAETRSEAFFVPSFRVVEALGALLVLLGVGKRRGR